MRSQWRADYERDVELARAQVDPGELAAAWATGRAQPAEQAITTVLERRARERAVQSH